MLDLASARWGELAQSHGTAEDIPRLLEALGALEGPEVRAELWYGVWATLCPDGRVYSAAYAAVPHLVAMTSVRDSDEQVAALHVAVQVEVARHEPGAPSIPDDLVTAYAGAIESMPAIVVALAGEPWDDITARILAAALLVGKRQPALARAVLEIGKA